MVVHERLAVTGQRAAASWSSTREPSRRRRWGRSSGRAGPRAGRTGRRATTGRRSAAAGQEASTAPHATGPAAASAGSAPRCRRPAGHPGARPGRPSRRPPSDRGRAGPWPPAARAPRRHPGSGWYDDATRAIRWGGTGPSSRLAHFAVPSWPDRRAVESGAACPLSSSPARRSTPRWARRSTRRRSPGTHQRRSAPDWRRRAGHHPIDALAACPAPTGSRPAGWPRARGRSAGGRPPAVPAGSVVHRMNLELPPAPQPEVLTLHDVIAWKYADESPPVTAAVAEIRRAAAVICVSQLHRPGGRRLPRHRGPGRRAQRRGRTILRRPGARPGVLDGLGIAPPFVLASGGASERKNLASLAAAWPERAPRPSRPHPGDDRAPAPATDRAVPAPCRSPPRRAGGRRADARPDGQRRGRRGPSSEEGFGLPALEAMAVRTPVGRRRHQLLPRGGGRRRTARRPDAGRRSPRGRCTPPPAPRSRRDGRAGRGAGARLHLETYGRGSRRCVAARRQHYLKRIRPT